jgi:hypothetical protein
VGASAIGFPLSKHWERWHCTHIVRPVCLFTVHVGGGSSPSPVMFSSHRHFHKLSCFCLLFGAAPPASRHVCLQFTWEVGLPSSPVEFSSLRYSHKLPRSWLLGTHPTPSPARGSPAHPACLFTVYLQSWAPHLFPACLYCSYCLLLSFSFFPRWRSVCPGGYAALAQACLWEYRGTAKLTWSTSFQPVCVPVTGGLGALLVSPFNVKWRFSVPAGVVNGSKLCLFSVIMPAKCVSGVSPRFHYRRLAFYFLPLVAILESPPKLKF